MLLEDWLKKHNITPNALAMDIGFAPATIYRALAGTQRLSARLAVKVEAYTKGEVSRTEAVWPEDYMEKDEDGNVQYMAFPKHRRLERGPPRKRGRPRLNPEEKK